MNFLIHIKGVSFLSERLFVFGIDYTAILCYNNSAFSVMRPINKLKGERFMPQEKFSRNAAITSQVIIIVWLALQLLTSVFQRSLLADMVRFGDLETPKVNSWTAIVLCLGGLSMTAANFMICQKKSKKAPLKTSAITAGLLPIAVRLAYVAQFRHASSAAEIEALSIYNSIYVEQLSYLLYVGAAVTIAAAAVYAFGDSETFPRKTSIASQIVIIVWTALQLLSSIFQRHVLKLFIADEQTINEAGKVNSYGAVALCFGGLLILAANFLICVKKGRLSPLLIASITTALLPIAAGRAMNVQNILAGYEGSDTFYVVSSYNTIVSSLSYLLYVGAVLAIAAGAVYIFSKGEKTVPEESGEVHDFE